MKTAVYPITARTPLSHAIEQWSGFCQRYTARTRESYQRRIKDFAAYIQAATIGDIHLPELQAYVNSLLGSHCHTGANGYITAVKSFCHWLSDIYDIPNPALKIRKFKDDTAEARCLKVEEYRKILVVLTGSDYHLIRFLANTGLRASELANLKPPDIKGNWLIVRGKGNKIRHIPLNQSAIESVPYILNFSRSRTAIFERCHRIARKAQIPPFGVHAIRHYFATELLKKQPIQKVSKVLGHSSVTVTEKIYWHFRHEDLAGLTDCLQ